MHYSGNRRLFALRLKQVVITKAFGPLLVIAFVVDSAACAQSPRQADLVTGPIERVPARSPDEWLIESLSVNVIASVKIPANRTGRIVELSVREGDRVVADQLVGKLDDRKASLAVDLARTRLAIAQSIQADDHPVESARLKHKQRQQAKNHHMVLLSIAEREAENSLSVLAAQKAEQTASSQLNRAVRSRSEYEASVSQSEIDVLRLDYERSQLESKQAQFEQTLAKLRLIAESEAAREHEMATELSEADISAAISQADVRKLQFQSQEHELAMAVNELKKHQFRSSMTGTVTTVAKQVGDWAMEGDTVLEIVQLDRLRAEGFVAIENLASFKKATSIKLIVESGTGPVSREGKVSFIDPLIDPVNQEVRVWIDFDNPSGEVMPGMRASALKAK